MYRNTEICMQKNDTDEDVNKRCLRGIEGKKQCCVFIFSIVVYRYYKPFLSIVKNEKKYSDVLRFIKMLSLEYVFWISVSEFSFSWVTSIITTKKESGFVYFIYVETYSYGEKLFYSLTFLSLYTFCCKGSIFQIYISVIYLDVV